MPSESDFIRWITSQQKCSDLVQRAAGDDLAILNWPGSDLLLAGADQVLDGVHFDSKMHAPRAIGRKAMNRNLSDCAAMACLPAAAIMSVALPKSVGIEYAKELYLGAKEAGEVFECPIVGGETGSWDGKLAVTIAILGRSAGIPPRTRSGAKVGHSIYVTGALGGSLSGRHMEFVPRVHEARAIAQAGPASAMIDISDGLSRDLAHICEESHVGALINSHAVPIHDDAIEMRRDGHSPLEHALHDGEDYELLFTAIGPDLSKLGVCIGVITKETGMRVVDENGKLRPLEPKGWEHSFLTRTSNSVKQTESIAAELARTLVGGECIALYGDLGAGKTQFVRGLVRGLGGDPRAVSSPTFVLLSVYDTPRMKVFHLDAYRAQGDEDFTAIGFSELLEQGGVVVVEWAERIKAWLPANHIAVRIQPTGARQRRITIEKSAQTSRKAHDL